VAQKIQILLIDDIDGTEAEETVRFALDGEEYEIELNKKRTAALRKTLARYAGAGRRVPGPGQRAPKPRRRPAPSGVDSTAVREWAKAQGIEVKDRGRIPAALVTQFRTATGT
jgi:hypothetical protein